MYGCVLVCVWRLVRECRAFAGRAGGALIGECVLTESGSRIFDNRLSYACLPVLGGCGCSRPFVAALRPRFCGFPGA